MPFGRFLLGLVFLYFHFPLSYSLLVNVTVDDSSPDPVTGQFINFGAGWNTGQNCSFCAVTTRGGMDVSRINAGSWHDSSFRKGAPLTANFAFSGSAIYVYGILASNQGPQVAREINMTFLIDEQEMGVFQQQLPDQLTYNVSLFGINGLTHGLHILTISNGQVGGNASIALIDYLIYSRETADAKNPPPHPTEVFRTKPSSPKPPIGRILGGLLGGLGILLLLLTLLLLYIRRRKAKAGTNHPTHEEAGMDESSATVTVFPITAVPTLLSIPDVRLKKKTAKTATNNNGLQWDSLSQWGGSVVTIATDSPRVASYGSSKPPDYTETEISPHQLDEKMDWKL